MLFIVMNHVVNKHFLILCFVSTSTVSSTTVYTALHDYGKNNFTNSV